MKYFIINDFDSFINKFNDNYYDYIIIQISASWCKPCQLIKNDFQDYIENYEINNACCLIIDYDILEEEEEFNNYFQINKIPFFYIFYRKNKIKDFQCSNLDQIKYNINTELIIEERESFDINDDF